MCATVASNLIERKLLIILKETNRYRLLDIIPKPDILILLAPRAHPALPGRVLPQTAGD